MAWISRSRRRIPERTFGVDTNINASESVYPRRLVNDQVGAPIAATYDNIYLGSDRVKIVIAAGGNVKTGTFHILMG